MNFEEKYLKYKNKYLNQKGGTNDTFYTIAFTEYDTLKQNFNLALESITKDAQSPKLIDTNEFTNSNAVITIKLNIIDSPEAAFKWTITHNRKEYIIQTKPTWNALYASNIYDKFFLKTGLIDPRFQQVTPRYNVPPPIDPIFPMPSTPNLLYILTDELKSLSINELKRLPINHSNVVDNSERNYILITKSDDSTLKIKINHVTYSITCNDISSVLTGQLLFKIILYINIYGYTTTSLTHIYSDDEGVNARIQSQVETAPLVNSDKPVKPNWSFFNPFKK